MILSHLCAFVSTFAIASAVVLVPHTIQSEYLDVQTKWVVCGCLITVMTLAIIAGIGCY